MFYFKDINKTGNDFGWKIWLHNAMVQGKRSDESVWTFTCLKLRYLQRLSGGENFGFNNAVFLSEREAADRNYALGFYMREHKCYPEKANLRECMDFYFQCCSMESTCDSMSIVAGKTPLLCLRRNIS